MPEEEAKKLTPEVRPDSQDASLEQGKEHVEGSAEQEERESERNALAEMSRKEASEAPAQEPLHSAPAVPSVAPAEKDAILVDIETMLADDLTELFLALPDEKKWEFKQKGEETAGKIREMITQGKVKMKKIFDLIREWLQMVPGVNTYFLEQEAKIKADNVLKYAEEQMKASQHSV